ncbi:hypothetical protein ACFOOP_19830 [Marinicaulis aureus]|uniref:Uncharacterized protein n=1 Tax=Hyphococcus aureus TaxID=2666033 RepID=A0ABW1L0H2_9PROT
MSPFDEYLEEIYRGREKPSCGAWRLEINYINIGEVTLARINGHEFFCWFWPNDSFAQFANDFERYVEETRQLCSSPPSFRKQGSWFVSKKDGFKRDESLFQKLVMLRSTLRDKISGETILRAHVLSVSDDKAWFTPKFKSPQVSLPYPDSKVFKIPPQAEQEWAWRLMSGEKMLGVLELMEVDQPSFHCAFREGPDYEDFRPIFDAQRSNAINQYNDAQAKKGFVEAQEKIAELKLLPVSPETKDVEFSVLYVDGTIARFRPRVVSE